MSQGDLIIIRDALKEVIEEQPRLSYGFPESNCYESY